MSDKQIIEYSEDFLAKIKLLKLDMHKFYVKIGAEETPPLDGSGRKIIARRGDGKDYIIEAYMRKKLDEYFPGWSWEMAAPLHFLGSEWVVAQGHLCIIDEYLLCFGIIPPIRKFFGVDSVRIQYGQDKPHTSENIVDIGDNCKSANSAALKYAINRLTNIGDDVYGKRLDEEGAGTTEFIILNSKEPQVARNVFMQYLTGKHILHSKAMSILGVTVWSEITDWADAYKKIQSEVK